MNDADWQPLWCELDHWSAERPARLWLRDDDAVSDTPALRRLTALTAHYRVPLMLAVIPAHADRSLAAHVAMHPEVTPVIHGWAHVNHAPPGQKSQELGDHRPLDTVLAELAEARTRLAALFGDRVAPVLVPPWNRIAPQVIQALPALGYTTVSTFGWPTAPSPLSQHNTHVDLIDWKGGRVCRDPAWLINELAAQLAESRRRGGEPVGVLTHHLAHDESAWVFLERLFLNTAGRPGVEWV